MTKKQKMQSDDLRFFQEAGRAGGKTNAHKLGDDSRRVFQQSGRKGGKVRAIKHSRRKLREWARQGGRPPRPYEVKAHALLKRFLVSVKKHQLAFDTVHAAKQTKFAAQRAVRVANLQAFRERFDRAQHKLAVSHAKRQGHITADHVASAQKTFERRRRVHQARFNATYAKRTARAMRLEDQYYNATKDRQIRFLAEQGKRKQRFEAQYDRLIHATRSAA